MNALRTPHATVGRLVGRLVDRHPQLGVVLERMEAVGAAVRKRVEEARAAAAVAPEEPDTPALRNPLDGFDGGTRFFVDFPRASGLPPPLPGMVGPRRGLL